MIKQIIFPTVEMDVLRLEFTEEEEKKFDSFTSEEKADFIIKNADLNVTLPSYRQMIIDLFEAGLDKLGIQQGICKECGCTQDDACHHPDYGSCCWEDENYNLCSHCANPEIAQDPRTERPEGVKKPIF